MFDKYLIDRAYQLSCSRGGPGTQKYPKVPTFSGTFCKNLLRKGTFGYLK